jgi:hypothetical protein
MTRNQKQAFAIGACLVAFAVFTFCTDGKIRQEADQIVEDRQVVTCQQLATSRPGDLKYVTLTDFEACKPFYYWDNQSFEFKPVDSGNYWDGDFALIPIFSTTQHGQQPPNALIRTLLYLCDTTPPIDPEYLQQLKSRRVDGEIWWLSESDEQALEKYYPGIRPFLCRVVIAGRWVPTHRGADRQRWVAVGAFVIGIAMVAFGIHGRFGRSAQPREPGDIAAQVW